LVAIWWGEVGLKRPAVEWVAAGRRMSAVRADTRTVPSTRRGAEPADVKRGSEMMKRKLKTPGGSSPPGGDPPALCVPVPAGVGPQEGAEEEGPGFEEALERALDDNGTATSTIRTPSS
jgi:hypothetical protein